MKRALSLLVALLMLVSVSAFAQSVVPQTMNFQGRLAKPDGTPVPDANVTLTFTLYDALTGGNALWSQTLTAATHNGTFTVLLGNGANGTQTGPLNAALFGGTRWLQIKVNSDAPLTPRQAFASTVYAFRSSTAELALTVASGSITLDSIASGVLNFANLSGQVTGSQIAPGTITNDRFANGGTALTAAQQAVLAKFSLGTSYNTVSTTPTGTTPYAVTVSGNYAYVANRNSNTFYVFDVSNPAGPVLVNAPGTATGSAPVSITVSGKYAFVTNFTSNTFDIFDVSNPASPTRVNGPNGTATLGGPAYCVASGGYAYIADYAGNGLQIFNISNPAAPTLINAPFGTSTGQQPQFLAIAGDYVYVTNSGSNTLQIFDVSNPVIPIPRSTTATGSTPLQVVVAGNFAYITCYGSNTLQIFNISNPVAPVLVNGPNGTATGTSPSFLAVSGNSAYVTNQASNTLQIFDVSNPANPVLTNTLATGTNPYGVAVSGGYIYVVNHGNNTLQIFGPTPAVNLAGSLNVSGDVNANGTVRANGVVLSSDARYKTHIATLPNALDDVLNLRGVSYDWDRDKWPDKRFGDSKQIGFIAQELERIFPELVTTDAQGYKSVNYIGVVPVLVEAVKAQQKQIDDMKAQLKRQDDQQAQINELKKQLALLLAATPQNAQNK